MPVISQYHIYRFDLQANPNALYVFGDNEARVGLGGQAREMRGEANAIGVATLKAPNVFWNEADAQRQIAVLNHDFVPVFEALEAGRTVIFPLDGIGTGLADLQRKSPTTFQHLLALVAHMSEYNL